MTITTLSSREFNQNAGKAKKAAKKSPVFITDRGRPTHVLLSIDAYQQMTATQASIVDLLEIPNGEHIDFKPPRLSGKLYQTADLS